MFKAISNAIQWIGRHFMGMIFLLIVVVVFSPKEELADPANLQEIKLSGAIMDSDAIVKEIEKAKESDKIKGVLLTVNSPGGAVAPSIEISYAIRELQKKKPVIAYVHLNIGVWGWFIGGEGAIPTPDPPPRTPIHVNGV